MLMAQAPLLTVRHAVKAFGGVPALRDGSLAVPAGRVVGLLGRTAPASRRW
jgi:ABC-2 type transport system ATP-binding protein